VKLLKKKLNEKTLVREMREIMGINHDKLSKKLIQGGKSGILESWNPPSPSGILENPRESSRILGNSNGILSSGIPRFSQKTEHFCSVLGMVPKKQNTFVPFWESFPN